MIQTVFITKYALTSGIDEVVMDVKETPFRKHCYGKWNGFNKSFFNNDFHLTKEEALADAEKKRIKKIESLKKQIIHLEEMSFIK